MLLIYSSKKVATFGFRNAIKISKFALFSKYDFPARFLAMLSATLGPTAMIIFLCCARLPWGRRENFSTKRSVADIPIFRIALASSSKVLPRASGTNETSFSEAGSWRRFPRFLIAASFTRLSGSSQTGISTFPAFLPPICPIRFTASKRTAGSSSRRNPFAIFRASAFFPSCCRPRAFSRLEQPEITKSRPTSPRSAP